MYFKVIGCNRVDWINLGHDRDKWGAAVNIEINIWII
jgi:hypothetical protein